MNQCTCGDKFMDAEDFRDHLPCLGSRQQRLENAIHALLESIDAGGAESYTKFTKAVIELRSLMRK